MPDPRETADSEDFDEYLVECDEHLAAVRRELLALEALADPGAVGRETLDALFRAFHTIKGLSGMVGVRAAEEVAHLLETYLTAVRNGDAPLTERGVDALLDGVALVEASVGAVQHGEPAPDTASLAARVAKLLPTMPGEGHAIEFSHGGAFGAHAEGEPAPGFRTPLTAEEQSRLDAALLRGERAWRIAFSPAAELAARGVNVGTMRVRLQGAGEIVHAEPVPTPGGVSFRFLFAAGAEFDPAVLAGDGVVAEPFEPPVKRKIAASPAAAGLAPANLVRVDLRRLDDVMRTVGELVLSRARLESGLARIAGYLPVAARRELEETALGIERHLRVLREEVMRVRMTPVRDLFARMRLVVRDLTRETGKEVELTTTGDETEVDKFVIERMADSLLHLVRNAVSHGLESPEARRAAGKPPKGRIELRAATAGGMIVLEVEDDGRGVLAEETFARAREAGLVPPNAATDPAAVLDLLCTPGFSTRGEADLASGRGVGMDVVRRSVEGLGGTLSLQTKPGAGSRFTARLPLTVAIADVITVSVGGHVFAVPQISVREVIPIERDAPTALENNELVRFQGSAIPLLRLGDVFGLPRPPGDFVALVTGEGTAAVALAVDRAIGLREVVVRALSDPLVQAPGIGGATELGDGRPILILDPAGLSRLVRRRGIHAARRIGG